RRCWRTWPIAPPPGRRRPPWRPPRPPRATSSSVSSPEVFWFAGGSLGGGAACSNRLVLDRVPQHADPFDLDLAHVVRLHPHGLKPPVRSRFLPMSHWLVRRWNLRIEPSLKQE